MPSTKRTRLSTPHHCISVLAALLCLIAISPAVAQEVSTNAMTNTPAAAPSGSAADKSLDQKSFDFRVGPFDLHPRLSAGFIYDDNILLAHTNKEADVDWMIQPGFQAVAGDDAALITYRDQNYDVLSLSPGSLIIQQPEAWPGKLLILDYSPRFQIFDDYTVNNSIDEFATLNLLLPMDKLILGLKQDYADQKTELIEFNQRASIQNINTTLSAAYQFGDKTSVESNLRRLSVDYNQTGLTGYTEYNTEDWFNYAVAEDLPVSVGVLAGWDDVTMHQDQTYEQLRARARYSYTEKLAFDVSVGGELREYENGKGDTFSPVFSASGLYRPAERTSLSLTASRELYASIFNGYNYATTGASFELRQGITDRFTAGFTAGYYNLEFSPVTVGPVKYSGNYYFTRISLDAKIIRHLTGQVFYQFLNSESQISPVVLDDQAGAKLTLNY